jgi:hypothetical protein
MDWEYGIVCLLAVLSVTVSILRCEKLERKAEALAEKMRETESCCERILEAYREMREKHDSLAEKVAELPTDQLEEIYNSEKKFQDGLNSILSYYGPPMESEKR